MTEKPQITVNDCEELYDRLLRDVNPQADRVSVWDELWRRLASKLGYDSNPNYERMLPAPGHNEPDTDENRIAAIGREIAKLLSDHSEKPRECMKVFNQLNTERKG